MNPELSTNMATWWKLSLRLDLRGGRSIAEDAVSPVSVSPLLATAANFLHDWRRHSHVGYAARKTRRVFHPLSPATSAEDIAEFSFPLCLALELYGSRLLIFHRQKYYILETEELDKVENEAQNSIILWGETSLGVPIVKTMSYEENIYH